MSPIERELVNKISKALQELGVQDPTTVEPLIEPPADLKFGDATSSIALRLAKQLKKPPRKIAEELAAKLTDWKTSVAGAGFINFDFGTGFAGEVIEDARKLGVRFGASTEGRPVKFLSNTR